MKYSVIILFFVSVFLLSACSSSDEEKARAKLNYAQALLERHDTLNALLQLDSISGLFPKAVYSANAAKNLSKQINFEILQSKERELDSLIVQIEELGKSFNTEKTQYDRYTQYIHKRQSFERAWDRSYIQVHLDERGELYLSSNYHGKNSLNHYGLRVYDGNDAARTDSIPVGDVDNHQSDFMEAKWEKVSYRNGRDNGVIEFIAQNTNRNLKAVFLGKEYYYIILESYDKLAVKDALELSKAMKRKTQLTAEIKSIQNKL